MDVEWHKRDHAPKDRPFLAFGRVTPNNSSPRPIRAIVEWDGHDYVLCPAAVDRTSFHVLFWAELFAEPNWEEPRVKFDASNDD